MVDVVIVIVMDSSDEIAVESFVLDYQTSTADARQTQTTLHTHTSHRHTISPLSVKFDCSHITSSSSTQVPTRAMVICSLEVVS